MGQKFSVGDRVIAIADFDNNFEIIGIASEVLGYNDNGLVAVKYDDHIEGHTLDERCEDGYGWYTDESCLELYQEPEIIVSMSYDEVMI